MGATTRKANFKKTFPIFTDASIPKYNKINAGVTKIPSIFPHAALKIAAASFPLELVVKTMTILIVKGTHEPITIPSANESDRAFTDFIKRVKPNTVPETTPKLKI